MEKEDDKVTRKRISLKRTSWIENQDDTEFFQNELPPGPFTKFECVHSFNENTPESKENKRKVAMDPQNTNFQWPTFFPECISTSKKSS